ncbi:MAG: hypothetical protein IKU24_05300 [Clostridia bacterium]|nr:hypothetical protein [Clostridia bacterium]
MLNALYLVAIILGISGQNISKKPFTLKAKGKGVFFFGALVSFTAMLFFVFTGKNLDFQLSYLPYSIGFATSYAVSTLFIVLSIRYGSLSLTSLFVSFSLMLPTFYGLLFLGDPVSMGLIPGILLLAASLYLTKQNGEKGGFSTKWLLFVFLAFCGNGMCSVVQKMQQVASGGKGKSEFMIIALAIDAIVLLALSFFKERKDFPAFGKAAILPAIIGGALNGMVNLFVMILSGKMPVSVMFPLISAGGILVTFLIPLIFYREKFTKVQLCGYLCGVLAVVFLNL